MAKRTGKFYYKNERETMELLSLKQVPGSGNGWVAKEDGENEHVLCQLKSTDATSIRIRKLDIDKLLANATVEHKLPVFAIQFLKSDELFLLVRPNDLTDVAAYIGSGGVESPRHDDSVDIGTTERRTPANTVKTGSTARERYSAQYASKFAKKRRSAL